MFVLLIRSIQSRDPAKVEKFLADKSIIDILQTVSDKTHAYQRLFRELHIISNAEISKLIVSNINMLDVSDETLAETINSSNVTVINAWLDEIAKQLDNSDICNKAQRFCKAIFQSSHKNILDCFFSHTLLLKWATLLHIFAKTVQESNDHIIEYLKSCFKFSSTKKGTIRILAHVLIYAISNGNIGLINSLFSIDPPMRLFEDEGHFFLFHVIKSGRLPDEDKLKFAARLIELGASTNAVKRETGEHVVHACAGEDNVKLLKLLASHGANLEARDNQGRDLCYYAFMSRLGTDVMQFRLPDHLNRTLIDFLKQRGHQASTTRNGTLLHWILNSVHPMGTLYNVPESHASSHSREIIIQILPFIEVNSPSESQLIDDGLALRSMPNAKRIHSHFAALFAHGIYDHMLIRSLLDAGEDPNAIAQHKRDNVLQIRHPLNYLTAHFDRFPASTRFKLLHVMGIMVDYNLVETEWFEFSPTMFTTGITGNSSANEIRYLIETYIRVLQAQARKDYELALKLLSQIHESAHTYSFIENCAGQFAHRFAVVCQHLGKFEDAYDWFLKAKKSTQQLSVANELVRLVCEWHEAFTKNFAPLNFGPWLKLFNHVEDLPDKELTATSHFMLGRLYTTLKGFDPVRQKELTHMHFSKVNYGPYREHAKQLLVPPEQKNIQMKLTL
jgi:hypothetical protein